MEVQNGNVFHSVFLCGNVRGCLRDAVMDGTNFFHQTRKEIKNGIFICFVRSRRYCGNALGTFGADILLLGLVKNIAGVCFFIPC